MKRVSATLRLTVHDRSALLPAQVSAIVIDVPPEIRNQLDVERYLQERLIDTVLPKLRNMVMNEYDKESEDVEWR